MRQFYQLRNLPLSIKSVVAADHPWFFGHFGHWHAAPQKGGQGQRPLLIAAGIALAVAGLTSLLPYQASEQADRAQIEAQARAGSAAAQLELGLAYRDGRFGLKADSAASALWLNRSALGGNDYAAALMGDALAAGNGVQADESAAESWWRQAAEHGDAYAQARLGAALASPDNSQAVRDEGRHWLESAALQGNPQARQALGIDSPSIGGKGMEAVLPHLGAVEQVIAPTANEADTLRSRAIAGDSTAQYQLAMRYRDGAWGGVDADPAQALDWLKRSANQGNSLAMTTLANAYERGTLSLEPDAEQAAFWRARARQL